MHDEVGRGVPGVVDSDEQKHQGDGCDQKKCALGRTLQQEGRDQQRAVGDRWQDCVPDPIRKDRLVFSCSQRALDDDCAVNQIQTRTKCFPYGTPEAALHHSADGLLIDWGPRLKNETGTSNSEARGISP